MFLIYKITLICPDITYHGQSLFYVGQHTLANSIEQFLDENYDYVGGGTLWNRYLKRLRRKYSSNWRTFLKKEVLCIITNNSQKVLDKAEEFFIKKEKAHYSYKLGGCNVLWGTANEFGSGSPAKFPEARKIISKKAKERFALDPKYKQISSKVGKRTIKSGKLTFKGHKHSLESRNKISRAVTGRLVSEETRKKISEKNMGHFVSEDTKRAVSLAHKGIPMSEEARKRMSIARKGVPISEKGRENIRKAKQAQSEHYRQMYTGEGNPAYGKRYKWINNGVKNKKLFEGQEMPEGYIQGYIKKNK